MENKKEINPKDYLSDPVSFLALGLGSGCAPKAPGTWGTVAALLLYLPMSQYFSPSEYGFLVVVSAFLGIWFCDHAAEQMGVHDHGSIVWDEFVGFWITMIAAPAGFAWLILGFLLFRFFDIWKPWPIGWLDKRVQGGLGIMVDDIIAGFFAFVVLQLVHLGLS